VEAAISHEDRIRVGIAEDHPIARRGLIDLMSTTDDMVVVGEAIDGESAIHLPEDATEVPDVLLVDVRMPGIDGLEVTRQITERYPNVGVVIITAYDDARSASQAVRAGARAYVLKTAEPQEILETVRMVAHGHVVFDSSVLQALGRESAEPSLQLPRREREVLQLLSRGLGNREIAEELDVSLETVKTHIERLFKHLGVTSRTDAVAKALRSGLID
jgi:DNA-binding NarL/FixJ family response regulator